MDHAPFRGIGKPSLPFYLSLGLVSILYYLYWPMSHAGCPPTNAEVVEDRTDPENVSSGLQANLQWVMRIARQKLKLYHHRAFPRSLSCGLCTVKGPNLYAFGGMGHRFLLQLQTASQTIMHVPFPPTCPSLARFAGQFRKIVSH